MEVHNVMGCLHAVNILTMTDYLKSVVPSEIPSGWPSEALKAQAIAARTYAYYHIFNDKNRGIYDLDCSTSFQVYRGMSAEKPATSKAVDDTNGIVITENSRPIISYFHSTCGGKTADDRYVWQGTDNGYLSSVKCEYCRDSPQYSWSGALDIVEIRRALEKKYPNTGKISNITFSRNEDRVTEVRVTHKNGVIRLSGNDFHLMFPPKTVKSLFFTAQKKDQTLILSGHGWGHGVGLCQWGARGMALQAWISKKYWGITTGIPIGKYQGLQNRSVALERAGTKRQ